ncbi:MAG TPA: hypothetical protein VLE73_00515 [Candidatus Saccharimonadales bacterium]|nr:hypothetical protein [Candidatus Saccharimonadales bacterium]
MSVYLGSPLEAAHEAARRIYPLPEADEGIQDGDVMALRAYAIEYGPRVIEHAEQAAIAPYRQEIAARIADLEQLLELEAAFNHGTDQGA